MSVASVNGIQIYYERRGEGAPVLFLNGSGSTLDGVAALLDIVAARCDLVAHDQRGLGRTTIPSGPYSMADYANDAAALLDAVGWESCRVVGISFGGMVAQELAVAFPKRVDRLALLCTSPGGPMPSYPLHELATLTDAERAVRYLPLLDTRFTPEWLEHHENDRNLVAMLANRQAETRSAEARRGESEQLDARRRHDVLDRLARVSCPTLVAAGRFDGIAPLANSEAMAQRIPDAVLKVYEGGHTFFAQDGRALSDIIDFVTAPEVG